MRDKPVVGVVGGGSFGTAIANIVAGNNYTTRLWMRDEQRAQSCEEQRENSQYLPGHKLHKNLRVTADLVECADHSDVLFMAIPSQSFREVTRQLAPLVQAGTTVVSCTKGIEDSGFTLMSQILEQELKEVRIGVLSGPNFAKEIVARQITGTVIASEDDSVCTEVQTLLSNAYFRVYSNHDRYAVELGGALKNIYAVAAGMASALGSGHNTLAVLLTRSLAEMGRFARELGSDPMAFLGLAGVGDLILTCTSDLSRNYRVGYALGSGKSLEEAVSALGQVAEGVNTIKLVKHKAEQLGVYMPIVTGLYEVLFNGRTIPEVIRGFMFGEHTHDVEYTGK